MNDLIESILKKDFTKANEIFESTMNEIMERKLFEMKKSVAAKCTSKDKEEKKDDDDDDSPFVGGDTKEKSTPYKNPRAKAKQLARAAMRKMRDKK